MGPNMKSSDTNSPQIEQINIPISDAERVFLANIAYQSSPVTKVKYNTGNWKILDSEENNQSGLEIYAMKKPGSDEVVFTVRGSDTTPDAKADWGLHGANLSFAGAGDLHPQMKEAILFVKKFMKDYREEHYTFSTAGHSKGGGIAQILSHVFGIPGTAVAPAPAGGVIDSDAFRKFLDDNDITPKGIPEHTFTNYIENGDIVSALEHIKLNPDYLYLVPVLNQGKAGLDIARKVLGEDIVPNLPHVDIEHLGDKIYLDLEPGKAWTRPTSASDQHDPLDDALALATQGPAYILGTQIKQCRENLKKLAETREEIEQAGHFNSTAVNKLATIDKTVSLLQQKMCSLEELRLHKLEQEYGHVDSWMKDVDFHVKNPQPEIVESLKEIMEKGQDDVINANIYLKETEYDNLLKRQQELLAERQDLENLAHQGFAPIITDKIAAGLDSIDRRLQDVTEELEKNRDNHLQFLKQKVGEYTDSWMQTDEFRKTFTGNHQEYNNLSPQEIEKIQDPETLEKIGRDLDEIQNTLPHQSGKQPAVTNSANLSENELHALDTWLDQSHTYTKDGFFYTCLPDGRIIKTPLLASTAEMGGGESVINEHTEESRHGQKLRDSEVNAARAFSGLMDGIESDDGLSIVRDGLDYIQAIDQYMELRDGKEGFLDNPAESIVGGVKNTISFGQAVGSGNGLDIAEESIRIAHAIDRYLDSSGNEYGTLIGSQGSTMLNMGEAGITLARAIDSGDELGMIQSSVDLVKEIDNYCSITSGNNASFSALDSTLGLEAGQAGTALREIGSAIALAVNIDRMDDVFQSGNAAAITYNLASTVNNAVITYNAAAQLAGAGQLSCSTIPGLGYIAAAAQLAQGDVKGAAITAVSTYLMTLGPYGWVAAAVLQIASMIMGKEGPPKPELYSVWMKTAILFPISAGTPA
ncbi:hypothetical protein DGMP_30850 [Desulfomarina profundi]|uniref:Uncharacterized protein n=1 Tax=Desulfomarina profundi TaxID=2772557 RepID=A0A8D5JN78_9BACT|nr:hypothetical protein [Desulfomarina profundi]BCL62392.1 hypothetical protein DGMP_30850 [Desulfomarina profundi]